MAPKIPDGRREQAEAAIAALNARDFEALGDMPFHPDVEIRSDLIALEGGTVYRGIQGVRQWARDVDSIFDGLSIEMIGFQDVDAERAVLVVRVTGLARTSGVPVDERRAQVWTWRNGKMWRNEAFADPREASKAAGLSEDSLAREDVGATPASRDGRPRTG